MIDYHKRHEAYIVMVRRAFETAGFIALDWSAEPNDPRDGAIQLDPASCGDWAYYEEVWVGWREERGWVAVPYTNGPEGLKAGHVFELEFLGGRMATVASPSVVVAGFADLVRVPVPTGHDRFPDADFPEHVQGDSENPLLEAALAVYQDALR